MSELAVQGCSFEASLDPATGSNITASLSAVSQPSSDIFVGNNGVYFNKITVQVASGAKVTLNNPPEGAISTLGELMAPDTIDITGTAGDILELPSENKAVQKNDEGSKSLTFTFDAPNSTKVTSPVEVTVKVSDAGQTDVIAT